MYSLGAQDPSTRIWTMQREVMATGRAFFGLALLKGTTQEVGELMTPYKKCAPVVSPASLSNQLHVVSGTNRYQSLLIPWFMHAVRRQQTPPAARSAWQTTTR